MSEDEDVWQVVESRRRRPRRGSFSKTTYQHQSRGGGGSISTVPGGSSNTSNTPIQGAYTYTVTHQLPEKKADELVKRELKRLEQIKVLMRETTLWGRVVNGLRTVFLQLGLEQADYPWDESTADVPTNLEDSQGSSPNENESELMGAHPPPTAPAKTPAPAAPLPRLEELVCYGIGSFSESHNSRYQLALALCLRDLLSFPLEPQRAPPSGSYGFSTNGAEKNPGSEDNRARASFEVPSAEEASFPLHPEKCPAPPLQKQKQPASREGVDKGAASSGCRGSWGPRPMLRMVVFDPVMTETDKAVLVALGCIIPHDENGKRCCYAGDGGDNGAAASGSSRAKATPTLFFMPHCPWRLYSNVLWANWFPEGESVSRQAFRARLLYCVVNPL